MQCERFQLQSAKVDFLFVVDDSGSMASSQNSLATAAQAAVDRAQRLVAGLAHGDGHLQLPRRGLGQLRQAAQVHPQPEQGEGVAHAEQRLHQQRLHAACPTTPQPATCSTADTTAGCQRWLLGGPRGNGSEGVLGAARKAIDDLKPGTDASAPSRSPRRARTPASWSSSWATRMIRPAAPPPPWPTAARAATRTRPARAARTCRTSSTSSATCRSGAPTNKTGKLITVHGIVCPAGSACGAPRARVTSATRREFNPQPANGGAAPRHGGQRSGGVLGSILDAASIKTSMDAIIADAIGNAGYKTIKPPIGASIKVAVDNVSNPAACTANNIPRSTVNGFDFDGSARTHLALRSVPPGQHDVAGRGVLPVLDQLGERPQRRRAVPGRPELQPDGAGPLRRPHAGLQRRGQRSACASPNCGDTCGSGTAVRHVDLLVRGHHRLAVLASGGPLRSARSPPVGRPQVGEGPRQSAKHLTKSRAMRRASASSSG